MEAFCQFPGDGGSDAESPEEPPVDTGAKLKEFGSERLLGMLHAFILLKPVLGKSLRDREQLVFKITDLTKFDRLKQNEEN